MTDVVRTLLKPALGALLKTQREIKPAERPRAYRLFVMDAGFWSGMNALQAGGPFAAVFALAIGASNYEVALITSITFIGMLMQIPGIFLVQNFPYRRAICVITSAVSRLLWVPIILIPFLFVDRGVTFMLQFMLLASVIGGTAIPAWHSYMKDGIAPADMPDVLARRTMWVVGAALVAFLLGGPFISLWESRMPDAPLYGYSILFTIGMVSGLAGSAAIFFLPEPKMKITERRMGRLLLEPLRDIRFLKLLKFTAPWSFTVHMSLPFFVVYLARQLEFSTMLVSMIFATGQISHILFARVWSQLIDRFSSKSVLSVACWIFLGSLLMWPFLTMPDKHALTVPLAFLIFVINGMALSGAMLSTMTASLKLSPAGKAHAYTTSYFLVLGVSGAIAAMLGGVLSGFFAARELSLALNWSAPTEALSFSAINLKALDFLFLISFGIGLIAMYRLGKFKEEGEVREKKVIEGLVGRLSASFKVATSARTYRRLTFYLFYPFR